MFAPLSYGVRFTETSLQSLENKIVPTSYPTPLEKRFTYQYLYQKSKYDSAKVLFLVKYVESVGTLLGHYREFTKLAE